MANAIDHKDLVVPPVASSLVAGRGTLRASAGSETPYIRVQSEPQSSSFCIRICAEMDQVRIALADSVEYYGAGNATSLEGNGASAASLLELALVSVV